jgi:hypothetical protein
MRARLRGVGRAALAVLALVLVAGLLAGPGRLHPLDAVADELGQGGTVPAALARPLWSDVTGRAGVSSMPGGAAGRERARAALAIISRSQRQGALRGILGSRPPRVVQLGPLQDRGRPVGVTALLALPVARHGVHATVPADGQAPGTGGVSVGRARFVAPVLRDVLVDVDLRHGTIIEVQPGPASRTSTWAAPPSPVPPATAVVASQTAPALVALSPGGPRFAPYDGTPALGPAGRDWPVSLIFAGHATVGKVKQALRTVGFTHLGESRRLVYAGPGGALRSDGDRGVKTACDANGTDIHLRLYAPPGTDRFTDPRFGDVVVATVHLDRGESCTTPPAEFGFSEVAERRVADVVASRLGWHVQPNRIALGNAEPFRRDLAAPDHLWWSNGRATLISVP